jgi:hypothetical protein
MKILKDDHFITLNKKLKLLYNNNHEFHQSSDIYIIRNNIS